MTQEEKKVVLEFLNQKKKSYIKTSNFINKLRKVENKEFHGKLSPKLNERLTDLNIAVEVIGNLVNEAKKEKAK